MPFRQVRTVTSHTLLCIGAAAALAFAPVRMALAQELAEPYGSESHDAISSWDASEATECVPTEETATVESADESSPSIEGSAELGIESVGEQMQVDESGDLAQPEALSEDSGESSLGDEVAIDDAIETPNATEVTKDVVNDASDDPAQDLSEQSETSKVNGLPSQNMYRLYNPNSGEHFYTSSLTEAQHVAAAGWRWEGVGWVAPGTGEAVHRLYNPFAGDHHYTTDATERDTLTGMGWRYEGVGWYSGGVVQVLRQYNPNAVAGAHNFTSSVAEDEALARAGWRSEGGAWMAASLDTIPISGFWLVCDSWGSRQRYWIGSDATVAVNRIVTANEGSGYAAYATPGNGAILRGAMDLGNGTVLLADNDGRLATQSGFVRSSSYGAGTQLYYLEDTGRGYSMARSGLVTVGDGHYWGQANTAAIMCGKMPKSDVLFVSNPKTGKLAWTVGWCVTDEYDGVIQRYYFTKSDLNGYIGARLGTFTEGGKRYYGRTDEGYVARGTYVLSQYEGVSADRTGEHYHDDTVVIADNDGVLLSRAQVGDLLVKAARSQIGASYDEEGSAYHAAANPADSSFNCSGFTWWVYSTLGLNISHNQGYYSYYTGEHNLENCQMWGVESRAAWKTNIADLRPGDLVFFSPTHDKYHTGHVGIYIGDGKMIDSNTTGVMVRSLMNGSSPKATFVGGGLPITLVV